MGKAGPYDNAFVATTLPIVEIAACIAPFAILVAYAGADVAQTYADSLDVAIWVAY